MKLPIALMLVCSIFIAFFVAAAIVYFLAKLTSMPYRKQSEIEDYKLAGTKYHANVEITSVKNRASTLNYHTGEKPNDEFKTPKTMIFNESDTPK